MHIKICAKHHHHHHHNGSYCCTSHLATNIAFRLWKREGGTTERRMSADNRRISGIDFPFPFPAFLLLLVPFPNPLFPYSLFQLDLRALVSSVHPTLFICSSLENDKLVKPHPHIYNRDTKIYHTHTHIYNKDTQIYHILDRYSNIPHSYICMYI